MWRHIILLMNVKLIDFVIDDGNYGRELILFSVSRYLHKKYCCDVEIYDTREILNSRKPNKIFYKFEDDFLKFKKIYSIEDIKNDI